MRLETLFKWQLVIAGIALALIVLVTIGDVVVKLITGVPVRGVYDVVQAAQVFVIFLALPEIFRTAANITVDLIDGLIGGKGVFLFRCAAAVVSAAFVLIVLVSAFPVARDAFRVDDYMLDTGIRYWVIWIPMLYGLALSLVAAIVQPTTMGSQAHHDRGDDR